MKPSDYFTSSQAWSRRKEAFLSSYLTKYEVKVERANPEFYFADSFARFLKCDGTFRSDPSMDHLVNRYSQMASGVGLKLRKIPSDSPLNRPAVQLLTDEGVPKGLAVPPEVSTLFRNESAMFFIDLQARPSIPFSSLESILHHRQPATEIIVNFDAETIWREAADRSVKRPDKTTSCDDLLNEAAKILGLDGLKDAIADGPSAALVSNYMGRIADYDFRVVAYQIRDELNLPTNCYLIYCTRDRENVRSMNNVIRATEDHLIKEYCTKLKVPLSDSFLCMDAFLRRQELRQLVLGCAERVTPVLKSALRWRLLFERFGEFYESDYDSVFAETIGGRSEGE